MATYTTGSAPAALLPGVNQWIGLSYKELEQEWRDLFQTFESSDRNFEEDVSFYGMGLAVNKPEAQNIVYDSMGQGFPTRYRHIVYALGFMISREAMEDNQYPQLAEAYSSAIGLSLRQTKENVAANIYNRAFNNSYVFGDGVELCSTANLIPKGGTFANKLGTDANLSELALEQAVIDLGDSKDEAGLRVAVRPRKLIVPRQSEFNAARILESQLRVATADNDPNIIRSHGLFPEGAKVNHYLSDSNAWFILTDVPGMKHFQRRAFEVKNDTPDFSSEVMKFKASERYSFGCSNKRAIFGSQGA